MKTKLFFIAFLLLGSIVGVKAQYIDSTPISDLDVDYLMIWSDKGPLLSSKITVRLDYGQGGRIGQISDDRRRVITFNSMITAINMMSKSGFEIDRIVRDSKSDTDFYLMKRRNNYNRGAAYSDESQTGTVDYDATTHN